MEREGQGQNPGEYDLRSEKRRRSHFSQSEPDLSVKRTPGMCKELPKRQLLIISAIYEVHCWFPSMDYLDPLSTPLPTWCALCEFSILTDDDSVAFPVLAFLDTGMNPGLNGTSKFTTSGDHFKEKHTKL